MIRIATLFSDFGGSTFALLNLCRLFNENGYPCEMYGPQSWFLKQSEFSRPLDAFEAGSSDTCIFHLVEQPERLPCRKVVLSCHEKHAFPLSGKQLSGYDVVHFVTEEQRAWHDYSGPAVVIPNANYDLSEVAAAIKKRNHGVAGVIGTIFPEKQTHLSIQRALNAGMHKVLIYGNIGDEGYFRQSVRPLFCEQVEYCGVENNRQAMYESISCVYHTSKSEVASFVQAECEIAGIPFYGNEAVCEFPVWSNEQVLQAWLKCLEL